MGKHSVMKLQGRLLNAGIADRRRSPEKAGLSADDYEQLYKTQVTQREVQKKKANRSLILK